MKTSALRKEQPDPKKTPILKAFKPRPRAVDVCDNSIDNLCCFLGAMGQTTWQICERTKLTPSQVVYRLHKGGVRRADWRDGSSPVAKFVFDTVQKKAQAIMTAEIRMNGGLVIGDARD